MNKKFKYLSLLSTFGLASLALVSCDVENLTSTSLESSSTTTTSNSDSTSTTYEQSSDGINYSFNEVAASGVAPTTTLNSIDTSILSPSTVGELSEVETDTTLSGEYSNGVKINTAKKGSITLTLNNATIYQNISEGKALWNVNKGVTVNLYIPEGTTSYIYNNTDDTNALHIKGELNISGGGKLVVISGSKSAIKCSSKINIDSTNLELSAASYGISGESFEAVNANINVIYAGKDGIRAEVENEGVSTAPTFDDSIGYVNLNDTNYDAVVEGDGIQANTKLTISGGNINISTQGTWVSYTSANIAEYELENDDFKWSKSGSSYIKVSSDEIGTNYSRYYALTQSSKGLKVSALTYTLSSNTSEELEVVSTDYQLLITNNATVNLTTSDSGSKVSYGDTIINGGSEVYVNAGNKGFAPEHDFYLDGENTKLVITNSYEAVEASHIYFNSGEAYFSASDDGINAASDYSLEEYKNLTIENNGAYVSVNASGDGIDSNGTISFNGGTTLVLGPTSGANQAIDADGKIYYNGGVVLAVGASGMSSTQNFTSSTSNYVIDVISNQSQSNVITIVDESGNVILSTTVNQSFGELIYSSNQLTKGSTYKVSIGSTTISLTISNTVASSGSSNEGNGRNPGFPGGR